MNARPISQEEFKTLVGTGNQGNFQFAANRPVIVDFSALEWCSHCRTLAPIFEELAGEYADRADFYTVNVDENEELTRNFNIRMVPTLLFAQPGKAPELLLGTLNRPQLEEKIKEIFSF